MPTGLSSGGLDVASMTNNGIRRCADAAISDCVLGILAISAIGDRIQPIRFSIINMIDRSFTRRLTFRDNRIA